jgi:hypothetical protein
VGLLGACLVGSPALTPWSLCYWPLNPALRAAWAGGDQIRLALGCQRVPVRWSKDLIEKSQLAVFYFINYCFSCGVTFTASQLWVLSFHRSEA